jgi:hypothetical protein
MDLKRMLFLGMAIISAGVGLFYAGHRYDFEERQNHIFAAIPLKDVQRLGASEYPAEALNRLKTEAGLSAIIVDERCLEDWALSGDAAIYTGSHLQRLVQMGAPPQKMPVSINPRHVYVWISDPIKRDMLLNTLDRHLAYPYTKWFGGTVIEISADWDEIKALGLGFEHTVIQQLKEAGWGVIPRLKAGSSALAVEELQLPATLLFEGISVAGFPQNLQETVVILKAGKHNWGWLEFTEQNGSRYLMDALPEQTIRVHSIADTEMAKITPQKAVDRYVRAISERKINGIVLHPFWLVPSPDGNLAQNIPYFKKVTDEIKAKGYDIKPEIGYQWKTFAETTIYTQIALSFGCVLLCLLLLHFFNITVVARDASLLCGCAAVAGGLCEYFGKTSYFSLVLIGLIICIAPACTVIGALRHSGWKRWAWLFGLPIFAIVLLIGLTSTPEFFMGISIIRGIKLALIIPLLIVAGYMVYTEKLSLKTIVKTCLTYPLNVGIAAALLLAAVGSVYVILRSGNGYPVAESETLFRQYLEGLLGLRPRTKELLGYSVLIWGILQQDVFRKKPWFWILPVLGTLPIISVMNTFSHVHTPLSISIFRSILGLILGCTLWKIADFCIKRVMRTYG